MGMATYTDAIETVSDEFHNLKMFLIISKINISVTRKAFRNYQWECPEIIIWHWMKVLQWSGLEVLFWENDKFILASERMRLNRKRIYEVRFTMYD